MICGLAWGTVTEDEAGAKWSLYHDQLSSEKPEVPVPDEGEGEDEEPIDLINYRDFLQQYVFPTTVDEATNVENQTAMEQAMINFAKQGSPGSKFKNVAEKMRKALFLPKNVKEELGVVEEEDVDPNAEEE